MLSSLLFLVGGLLSAFTPGGYSGLLAGRLACGVGAVLQVALTSALPGLAIGVWAAFRQPLCQGQEMATNVHTIWITKQFGLRSNSVH